jgi:two-component system cell cycle sensor histidine kinase PleC
MARASTAAASARAEAWQNFALFRAVPTLRNPDVELVVRWAVPVALAAFVALLIGVSYAFIFDEQDRIIAAATTDVELIASVIADDIDVRMLASMDKSPTAALAHAIPLRTLARGQRVLLTNQGGTVIASYPDPRLTGTMAEHLGASQALTVFAEKAGVMRITLPNGSDALATVRSLHEPLGQVAIIHPMTDVLSDWRAALYRIEVLLACTGGVLSALAGAYFWQATRARRADTSCKKMRDRVDMVLSRGHCGLWDWDLASGHVDWSLSMYQILGMSPRAKALSTAEVNSLIHPADDDLDEALRRVSMGEGNAIDHVFRMRNADGAWVWLRARAELVTGAPEGPHLVGIAIDVTETMALEERTAKADMRLRDAIETISEAFVVWDAENRLVMCNSKFQRFYDLPQEAVAPGTPYATVMECGTPPVVQAQVALARQQPMGARTFEAQLGDGRWLQIDERRTKDGGYVSVGTDITALKRNEEQLMDSERRLMHSVVDLRKSRQDLETQTQVLAELAEKYLEQKAEAENANRAKSDFLANMGHELRTPLNAILGFSEIMMMESYGELGSPLYQEYCKDIHASGQYLLNVIADILEMSRLEAGRVRLEKAEFVVREAIETALGAVAETASANAIKIETDVSIDTKLLADRTAIEKVLAILLHNSVKYTPAGGNVTVRVRTIQGALNIYVKDTGVGITPETIARLGRPFEQSDKILKDGMRGSGLGLAIARSLVDLHGGSMRIKSKPGLGTLVMVHLPGRVQGRPQLLVTNPSVRATPRASRLAIQPVASKVRKISRTA